MAPGDEDFILGILNTPSGDDLKLKVLEAKGLLKPPAPVAAPRREPTPKADKSPTARKQALEDLGPLEDRDWVTMAEACGLRRILISKGYRVATEEGWGTQPLGVGKTMLYWKPDVLKAEGGGQPVPTLQKPEFTEREELVEAAPVLEELFPNGKSGETEPVLDPADEEETGENMGIKIGAATNVEIRDVHILNKATEEPREGDAGVYKLAGELWVTAAVGASLLHITEKRFNKLLPRPGTFKPVRNQHVPTDDGKGIAVYNLIGLKNSMLWMRGEEELSDHLKNS